MQRTYYHQPLLVTIGLALLMIWHGPIPQPAHYHAFADTRSFLGVQNGADVLSNLGFALAGIWGFLHLGSARSTGPVLAGYRLFLVALVLTAAGSAGYHLQPDDGRLIWDRIPIALACAGLLAAVHAETARFRNTAGGATRNTVLLAAAAVASVAWWSFTGDLRPYLLLQALPLILIPLWQYLHDAPRADRQAFGLAILLYILAKFAELGDDEILRISGFVSGHTLKHLLASAAAGTIVARLALRRKSST